MRLTSRISGGGIARFLLGRLMWLLDSVILAYPLLLLRGRLFTARRRDVLRRVIRRLVVRAAVMARLLFYVLIRVLTDWPGRSGGFEILGVKLIFTSSLR